MLFHPSKQALFSRNVHRKKYRLKHRRSSKHPLNSSRTILCIFILIIAGILIIQLFFLDEFVFNSAPVAAYQTPSAKLGHEKWREWDFDAHTITPETNQYCQNTKKKYLTFNSNNQTYTKNDKKFNSINTAFVSIKICGITKKNFTSNKTINEILQWYQSINKYYPTFDKLVITHKQCCDDVTRLVNEINIVIEKNAHEYNNINTQFANNIINSNLVRIQVSCFPDWNIYRDVPRKIRMNAKHFKNCCNVYELTKFDAFSMVNRYKWMFLLDWDIRIIKPIDELFYCMESGKFDFLATTGAMAPLNGGMWILKTNMDTYNEIRYYIKNGKYSFDQGWFYSGVKRYFGSETNQGFGFWYFFLHKKQENIKRDNANFVVVNDVETHVNAYYLSQPMYNCQKQLKNFTKIDHKCGDKPRPKSPQNETTHSNTTTKLPETTR